MRECIFLTWHALIAYLFCQGVSEGGNLEGIVKRAFPGTLSLNLLSRNSSYSTKPVKDIWRRNSLYKHLK